MFLLNKVDNYKEIMGTLAMGLIKSKSTGEITECFNSSGIFTGEASLAGLPFSYAKQALKAYFDVCLSYPFLAGRLSWLRVTDSYARHYATCYIQFGGEPLSGGGIELNLKNYAHPYKMDRYYRTDLDHSYHPANTTEASIIYHELGHALDGYISHMKPDELISGGKHLNLSEYLRKVTLKRLDIRCREITDELSKYATSKPEEWFAECFAEFQQSKAPRPMAMECMYSLDELLRRMYAQRIVSLINFHAV